MTLADVPESKLVEQLKLLCSSRSLDIRIMSSIHVLRAEALRFSKVSHLLGKKCMEMHGISWKIMDGILESIRSWNGISMAGWPGGPSSTFKAGP